MRCRYPLRFLELTRIQSYVVGAVIWFLAFMHPTLYIVQNLIYSTDTRKIVLYPPKSSCDYQHKHLLALHWQITDLSCAVVYCFVPLIILLSSNVGLLIIVWRRSRRTIKKSSVFLILTLTSTFCLSYTPYVVKYSIPILKGDPDLMADWFKTLTYFILYINSWFDPFVYFATNVTFRRYVYCVFTCRPWEPSTTLVTVTTVEASVVVRNILARSHTSAVIMNRPLLARHSSAASFRVVRSSSSRCYRDASGVERCHNNDITRYHNNDITRYHSEPSDVAAARSQSDVTRYPYSRPSPRPVSLRRKLSAGSFRKKLLKSRTVGGLKVPRSGSVKTGEVKGSGKTVGFSKDC